jgi:hypothetical protein
MRRIDPPAAVSGYDEDPLTHEWSVLDALDVAGFTPAEQAQFMKAWDANRDALTPHQADLLFRYESYVYPEVSR